MNILPWLLQQCMCISSFTRNIYLDYTDKSSSCGWILFLNVESTNIFHELFVISLDIDGMCNLLS